MLTEIYIEALLVDEEAADQVWGAWDAAVAFLDEFSEKLGKPCVLEGYRDQFQ